jgi:putative hydrolase of the HAD superfamily
LGVTGLLGVRAVLFDVNGTLVDIHTEEGMEQIFRAAGHFLTYQGVDLRRGEVRDRYFALLKEQQRTSSEEYPEFDAVAIWGTILDENATAYTRAAT